MHAIWLQVLATMPAVLISRQSVGMSKHHSALVCHLSMYKAAIGPVRLPQATVIERHHPPLLVVSPLKASCYTCTCVSSCA